MLIQTLIKLESTNIIERTVYPIVPLKTEYNLMASRIELIEPLEAMADGAGQHQAQLRLICKRRNQETLRTRILRDLGTWGLGDWGTWGLGDWETERLGESNA